jgi:arylformamidase
VAPASAARLSLAISFGEFGMKVFRDLTQEELDRAYDQRQWAPNAQEVIARYGTESAKARSRLRVIADLAYGPSPEETLDIFPAAKSAAPIHVFIHGGAWRMLSKAESCFAAPAFVDAGIHFVALNFANLPQVRLPEMAAQIRRAIAFVHQKASTFGGDAEAITISGHSSGGHLAGVVLTTDWMRYGLPADAVKGGLCASGMYELEPVLLSARSSYVKLDAAEAAALSPIRHLDSIRCPVSIAWGALESPEFKRQGEEFARALAKAGKLRGEVVLPGFNHFEVVESLASREGALFQEVMRLM